MPGTDPVAVVEGVVPVPVVEGVVPVPEGVVPVPAVVDAGEPRLTVCKVRNNNNTAIHVK